MDEAQRVTSYKDIGAELGKKLIKLYNEKIFPRQGKVFADMLFQSGIEAGSYIAALADVEEREVKINLATNAMVQLNRTQYLVQVMCAAGYYTSANVVGIEEYLGALIRAMRDLLNILYAKPNVESVRPAPAQTAPAKPKTEQVKPAPQPVNTDPDGFNAPVNK